MAQLVDPFVPVHDSLKRSLQRERAAASASEAAAQADEYHIKPQPHGVIDGILPAKPPARKQPAQPARPIPYSPPAGPLHLQYMTRPAIPASRPHTRTPPQTVPQAVQAQAQPSAEPVVEEPRTKFTWEKQPQTHRKTSTIALVGGVAIASLSLFSVEIGQIALAAYAIVAIWRRWPSQQTFALALVMFGGIILTSLIEPLQYIAENLAVYAFLLLCIGTVSLAREVRRDMKQAEA